MPGALVCPMDHQGGFPRGNNDNEVEPCRLLGVSKNECREGGEREEGLASPWLRHSYTGNGKALVQPEPSQMKHISASVTLQN